MTWYYFVDTTILIPIRAHSHFLGRKKIHHRDTENKEIAQR